jgi:hypothetical protein
MSWETIISIIEPKLFILIIFIWCLGLFFKKLPKFKAEWTIPFILLAISIVITLLWIAIVIGRGFIAPVYVTAIVQGGIIAAVAVFGNESIKQVFVKRIKDNQKE